MPRPNSRSTPITKNDVAATPAIEAISGRIIILRGRRVMLDGDLAALYGISTGRFNEAVRRNLARFPGDFMFQLSNQELAVLRSQIAISNVGRGGRRYRPYAFTEHGAIMAATILNTPRATEVSVYVVRAFVELREALIGHKAVAKRLDELESRLEKKLAIHDEALAGITRCYSRADGAYRDGAQGRIGFVQEE